MRVGLLDPHGSRAWRVLGYILPALLVCFSIWGPIDGTPALVTAILGLLLWNGVGVHGLRQFSMRNAELLLGPGYVDVKKAGTRNQRIHAKAIKGATTTRTSTGVVLTLHHEKRDQPITLELANDAEAEKVRHALGIGHGGFGEIPFRTDSDSAHRVGLVSRMIALGLLGLALPIAIGAGDAAIALLTFGVMATLIGLTGFTRMSHASVVMTPEGLRLKTVRGWFALPYDQIHHLDDHARGYVFTVPPPWSSVAVQRSGPLLGGQSVKEREILTAQVRAASERARGLGPQKPDVTGRVDALRRKGESPRDWLVRLDMAGQLLGAGAGYRGHTLDADDLWAILEDPEAEADLRAAAARILRHSTAPETRVRIATAVAAVRDESTNRRLRIAISGDLDAASQELAYLDATEPPKQQQQQVMHPQTYGR